MSKRCDIDALRAWAQILGNNIGKPQMATRHAELLEDAIAELRALRKVAAALREFDSVGDSLLDTAMRLNDEYLREFGGDDDWEEEIDEYEDEEPEGD